MNGLFTPFKNKIISSICMLIYNHNKLETLKNIWIDKQSQIKWSDEKNTSSSRNKPPSRSSITSYPH